MMENENNKAIAKLYAWLMRIGSRLADFKSYLKELYGNELEVIKKIELLGLAVEIWVDKLSKIESSLHKLPLQSIISIIKDDFDFKELTFEQNHSEFDFEVWFDNFICFQEQLVRIKTSLKELNCNSSLIEEINEIILYSDKLIEIIEEFI